MEKFINRCFPDITVKVVDSGESNLFRYDENIKFVKGMYLNKLRSPLLAHIDLSECVSLVRNIDAADRAIAR